MEKAILKTLIYSSIFDYPLKINEIHKWLIGKKITLRQVEKALNNLYKVSSIGYRGKYYFLRKQHNLISQRLRKEKQSTSYFQKAKILAQILKIIPWIKLVGVSGGLAMNNAGKSDDIDLFIITSYNRLWISRLLAVGLLSLVGQRRKKTDNGRKIAGKLCLNIFLTEDELQQKEKDIFVAHEVLQMRPLWQRDGVYSKYLEDNSWAFKYLPNWITSEIQSVSKETTFGRTKFKVQNYNFKLKIFDLLEKVARWLQLKIMQKPQGMERIEQGALYFHPNDCRLKVLEKYKKQLTKFIN